MQSEIITLETFEKALIYAINKHSGTIRKGVDAAGFQRPYIIHPFSVMLRIFNNKVSKNMYLLACASVLHDVAEDCFEDTEEGLKEIEEQFGEHIAGLVAELTLDKEKYKTIGKKEYLAQELNTMSSYALAIKLCDRLDNVSDLNTMDADFKKYYINQTRYILAKLDRKLSPTHKSLIDQIHNVINSYSGETIKYKK